MLDMEQQILDNEIATWIQSDSRELVRKNNPRLGNTIVVLETPRNRIDIIRGWMMNGKAYVSVDVRDGDTDEAFTKLMELMH